MTSQVIRDLINRINSFNVDIDDWVNVKLNGWTESSALNQEHYTVKMYSELLQMKNRLVERLNVELKKE